MRCGAFDPVVHTALIMYAAAAPKNPPLFEYSGTLIHAAEARVRVLDGIVSVPVICMDIELDNALHNQMHIEQPFPPGHFKQARAAAYRLIKGTRITVQVQPLDIRLVAANAAHIHVIKSPVEGQTS